MNDDQAFIDTILANSNDETPKLVYADWLEERNVPRGEFLRLDSAMIGMRIGTPRYESARDLLVELRKDIDSKWARCATFRPITSVETLIQFLREFHRYWMEDPTLDPLMIPVDLQYVLTAIYRELGGLFGVNEFVNPFCHQDDHASPKRILREDDAVEFAWENQGNWTCRFADEGIDPPVFSNASGGTNRFLKVCDSLSHFLTTLTLQEAVMSSPYSTTRDSPLGEIFTVPHFSLWASGQLVHATQTRNFFAIPQHDVIVMELEGMFFVGAHSDDVEQVLSDD